MDYTKIKEIFPPIHHYGKYSVSNFGNVKNIKTGRILKPGIRKGYKYVCLCNDDGHKKIAIHRLVASAFLLNVESKCCIDHQDGNKLNNKLENLRYASSSENNMNRKISSRNTSNVKGVGWCKENNNWRARITINGKLIYLGSFENKTDAIEVRKNAFLKYFGEFLNQCEK